MLIPTDEMTKIYSLLVKIKNLAEHPNTPQNEAAAAALKYRELLLKYRLSEGDIKTHHDTDDFVRNRMKPCSKLAGWYSNLAQVVAEFMGCAVVTCITYKGSKKQELSFVGRTKDTLRAIDLFNSLVTGFKAAANYSYFDYCNDPHPPALITPTRFKTSFLYGCVVGLHDKIKEIESEHAEYRPSTALVLMKTAAADRFVSEVLKITEGKQARTVAVRPDAFRAGVREGRRTRILPELALVPE
jgi:hypothetical protein